MEVNGNSQTTLISGWETVKKAVTQKQGRVWEEIEMEELWKAKIQGCGRAQRGNGDR
jgi:hypothetical protein